MQTDMILVNRAPVLTLWGAVVAERLGYAPDTALTLGRALAAINAQSKGRTLGIFQAAAGSGEPVRAAPREAEPEQRAVELMGRELTLVKTPAGDRAAIKGEIVEPEAIERYLAGKLGDDLPRVRAAMETLAGSLPPSRLADRAFALYEAFRPAIPAGVKGWGAPGELDLAKVRSLGR